MSRIVVTFDSVQTNGGRADVTNWDFSYGEERRIRVTLDDLFVFEFKLPDNFLTATFLPVKLTLISTEIPDDELEANPIWYSTIYLDNNDCDYIRRMLVENNKLSIK